MVYSREPMVYAAPRSRACDDPDRAAALEGLARADAVGADDAGQGSAEGGLGVAGVGLQWDQVAAVVTLQPPRRGLRIAPNAPGGYRACSRRQGLTPLKYTSAWTTKRSPTLYLPSVVLRPHLDDGDRGLVPMTMGSLARSRP